LAVEEIPVKTASRLTEFPMRGFWRARMIGDSKEGKFDVLCDFVENIDSAGDSRLSNGKLDDVGNAPW
jgi:hypothetical protein